MDNQEYGKRIVDAVRRVQSGQGTPDDDIFLGQALTRLAPSSPTYRLIVSARGKGSFTQPDRLETFNNQDRRNPIQQLGDMAGYRGPSPTADFLMGDPGASEVDWNAPVGGSGGPPSHTNLRQPAWQMPTGQDDWTVTGNEPNRPDAPDFNVSSAAQAVSMPGMGGITSGREFSQPELNQFFGVPPDMTFSDMGAAGVQMMLDNPSAYLSRFAKEKGGGENMAAFLADPYDAARALASYGSFSGRGNDLRGGVGMGNTQMLGDIEQFLAQYSEPGNFVDPNAVYSDVFNRASNTDFSQVMNPETNLPFTPQETVDITNQALMASAPFMVQEGQAWLQAILQDAASDYINGIASGEIDSSVTYPAFLRERGIDQIMQG